MGSVDHLPPVLSNYTRAGAVGQVTVAQVEATDIVGVYAFCQCNGTVANIGFRVGPGVVNLNLAAYMDGANEIPVMIAAFWTTAAILWMISLPSNQFYDPLPIGPTCRPRVAAGLEDRE